jgi:hypothetical protein
MKLSAHEPVEHSQTVASLKKIFKEASYLNKKYNQYSKETQNSPHIHIICPCLKDYDFIVIFLSTKVGCILRHLHCES